MNPEEIKDVLSLGENAHVEFKAGRVVSSVIGPIVCGFLNTSGGVIVCGVGDRGQIVGVENSHLGASRLEEKLRMGTSPKALVSVASQVLDGKELLIVEVPAGQDVPYGFENTIYTREGAETRRATVETIRDMILRKQVEPERWERRFSSGSIEHDVDADEVGAATRAIQRKQRNFFEAKGTAAVSSVLEALAMAKYGRLTNGGDVLFGRDPARRLPQVRVRAVALLQDKASSEFQDLKSFEGPLVPLLEQVAAFIGRNTPTSARFASGTLLRQEQPLYPEHAIREALVNAFAHRDYSSSSGGVTVTIYPRRLEIWNSGGLPDGVTPETLAQGQLSILRNPDIAHVLYLRGFMEKLGRGSVLMLQACRERGLPDPRWVSQKSGVTLTFFAPEATPEVAPEDVPEVTPEAEKLLAALEGAVAMSRHELQAALGLKDAEHFRKAYLQPAIHENLIEMTLPDKPSSSKQRYRATARGRAARAGKRQ